MPAYEEALAGVDNANSDAAASGEENSDAIAGVGDSAADAAEQVQALADEIAGFADASFDSRAANRDLEESLAALRDRLGENGLNFEIATDAGLQNEAALDAVARATNEAAAAVWLQTGNQDAANAKLEEGRQKLIVILTPYYGSRDAAAAYVDQLNLISPQKVTEIVANTENASAKILTYKQQLDNIPKILTTEARAQITMEMFKNWSESSNANGGGGGLYAYENGGIHENVAAMHAFAAGGGVDTGIYKGGTPIIKFAEQETGWEAFISGKPSQRERNRQIWLETGERLGMNSGGQREVVHVPTHVTVVDADNRMVGTMKVVANK